MVYLELLCILYRDKGYYIEYNDQTRDDVIWELRKVLSGQYEPKAKTIRKLINRLAACRLFNHDLYERGFITSHRAQEQYYRRTIKRSDVKVNYDIWLLTADEMKQISQSSPIYLNFISAGKTEVSASKKEFLTAEIPQRKGEENKEDKSKLNHMISEDRALFSVKEKFEEAFGTAPNKGVLSVAAELMEEGRSVEQLLEAVALAARNHRRAPKKNIYSYTITLMRKHVQERPAVEPPSKVCEWEQKWIDDVRMYYDEKALDDDR